jgi:hypothetical protein
MAENKVLSRPAGAPPSRRFFFANPVTRSINLRDISQAEDAPGE